MGTVNAEGSSIAANGFGRFDNDTVSGNATPEAPDGTPAFSFLSTQKLASVAPCFSEAIMCTFVSCDEISR